MSTLHPTIDVARFWRDCYLTAPAVFSPTQLDELRAEADRVLALCAADPVRYARRAPAWAEQCVAIAVLAATAVLLNWITTGDHLLRTIANGYWPVAGVDLVLLVSATVAALVALKLWQSAPHADTAIAAHRAEVAHA